MSTPNVLTEFDDGLLTVTLNRPQAMNALSTELARELTRTWERARDPEVRAVVVTAAGRGFCAGADLKEVRSGDIATESLRVTFHPHVLAFVSIEKPVIAAINGPVAGAGLSIALGADVRFGSPTAKLVPAFSRIGLVPDTGVGLLASRILGSSGALAWLGSGRTLLPDEAVQRGVFAAVDEDPLACAHQCARELMAVPGRAYGLTKRLLWEEDRVRLLAHLDRELDLQRLAVADPARERARAETLASLGSAHRS